MHKTSNVYDNTYTLLPSGYIYNIQDETLHLNNETRTDGGTQIVRKSYQDDHYDFNLDSSIEKPYNGPYPCFDELDTDSIPCQRKEFKLYKINTDNWMAPLWRVFAVHKAQTMPRI